MMAQSLVAYLLHLTQYVWDNEETARGTREFSLAWYAMHAWPEHASLSGAISRSFDATDTLHIQMQRLLSDDHVLTRLIRLFEPHLPIEGPELAKALQDMKMIWCYSCSLNVGEVVRTSIFSSTDGRDIPISYNRVEALGCRVCDKLAHAKSQSKAVGLQGITPASYDLTLRQLMSASNSDWENDSFLDLCLALPEGLLATHLWSNPDLAVTIVRFHRTNSLGAARLPTLLHLPSLQQRRTPSTPTPGNVEVEAEAHTATHNKVKVEGSPAHAATQNKVKEAPLAHNDAGPMPKEERPQLGSHWT